MAYKVIILYQLYMPSYFLGTFTEYPFLFPDDQLCILWEIPDTGSRKAIETGDVWTAQQTYEWLQKLLQQFTDESPDADQAVPGKQRFFRKMLDFFFK